MPRLLPDDVRKWTGRAVVLSCDVLDGGGYRLRVRLPSELPDALEGGHFFMLRTEAEDFPFLSRPFSVHDVTPGGNGPDLDFLLKIVGAGTRCLAELRKGDALELAGPLGATFPWGDDPERRTLLVAGGIGLPPLHLFLRRRLQEQRADGVLVLYGARTRSQLFALDTLEQLGVEVRTATEDGSHGATGRVDSLLVTALDELERGPVQVFTCGPDPMLARVAEIAAERDVPCWASLETLMACGFGVCNACAVPYLASAPPGYRYARSCLDGPVMDASRILWHHAH